MTACIETPVITQPADPLVTVTVSDADGRAVEELFRDVYPRLAGRVRRLVDDDDTAHEIASEAFVRLLARWARVDSPRSYLYTIATNLIRDHWRKTERERRAVRSMTAGTAAEPVTCPAQDVDVRDLLAALPPRLRDPFLLHYYGGFGIRDVATLLRKPEGTIKADLLAARTRLKAALRERHSRVARSDRKYLGPEMNVSCPLDSCVRRR
jgi:RNA polymerase sigma-70 factor (ECF subfamily)